MGKYIGNHKMKTNIALFKTIRPLPLMIGG